MEILHVSARGLRKKLRKYRTKGYILKRVPPLTIQTLCPAKIWQDYHFWGALFVTRR